MVVGKASGFETSPHTDLHVTCPASVKAPPSHDRTISRFSQPEKKKTLLLNQTRKKQKHSQWNYHQAQITTTSMTRMLNHPFWQLGLVSNVLSSELEFGEKILKNCKEQPLVPIGVGMTLGALLLSVKAIRRGDAKTANRMFVWRVTLQGLTVVALVAGSYYIGINDKWKVDHDQELRKKAEVREKMWIEELERIDVAAKERAARAEQFRAARAKQEAGEK